MDRFNGDYIRQQPEYRYLTNKHIRRVIQTCVEDGQVKLRFGHQPDPPQENAVRLPQRPRSRSLIRSAASAVYELTSAQLDRLTAAKSGAGRQATSATQSSERGQGRYRGCDPRSSASASAGSRALQESHLAGVAGALADSKEPQKGASRLAAAALSGEVSQDRYTHRDETGLTAHSSTRISDSQKTTDQLAAGETRQGEFYSHRETEDVASDTQIPLETSNGSDHPTGPLAVKSETATFSSGQNCPGRTVRVENASEGEDTSSSKRRGSSAPRGYEDEGHIDNETHEPGENQTKAEETITHGTGLPKRTRDRYTISKDVDTKDADGQNQTRNIIKVSILSTETGPKSDKNKDVDSIIESSSDLEEKKTYEETLTEGLSVDVNYTRINAEGNDDHATHASMQVTNTIKNRDLTPQKEGERLNSNQPSNASECNQEVSIDQNIDSNAQHLSAYNTTARTDSANTRVNFSKGGSAHVDRIGDRTSNFVSPEMQNEGKSSKSAGVLSQKSCKEAEHPRKTRTPKATNKPHTPRRNATTRGKKAQDKLQTQRRKKAIVTASLRGSPDMKKETETGRQNEEDASGIEQASTAASKSELEDHRYRGIRCSSASLQTAVSRYGNSGEKQERVEVQNGKSLLQAKDTDVENCHSENPLKGQSLQECVHTQEVSPKTDTTSDENYRSQLPRPEQVPHTLQKEMSLVEDQPNDEPERRKDQANDMERRNDKALDAEKRKDETNDVGRRKDQANDADRRKDEAVVVERKSDQANDAEIRFDQNVTSVDASQPTDENSSSNHRVQTNINSAEKDQFLTNSDAKSDEHQADSESVTAFPTPVTRVDVTESRTNRNKSDVSPVTVNTTDNYLEDSEETRNQNEGEENEESPSRFIIPVVVVDDASNDSDVSDYSDDVDAVSINADEYLALVQCVQSDHHEGDGPSSAPQINDKEELLNRLTSRVLRNHFKNTRLKVPQSPKMSDEKMPLRREEDVSNRLKAGSDQIRRYSIPAALEAAGLRRALTPFTYNVEFDSYTAFRHNTPRDSASREVPPQSPTQSHNLLLPPATSGGVGGGGESLKSALSSRRSSTASAGPLRYDRGLSESSAFNRQVSWAQGSGAVSRRRHSSVHSKHFSDPSNSTLHNHHKFALSHHLNGPILEDSDDLERLRRGSVQSSRRYSEAGSRRMSTVSGVSGGGRRASRVDSNLAEDFEAHHLSRQPSQYDPQYEKTELYNHQRENMFNKASQYLSPVRGGLRHLQVHYSKTNISHNDSIIFAHLLRAAHVKNAAVEDGVYSLERRLYNRRHTQTPHATTFFDTPDVIRAARKDRDALSKVLSPDAKKKKERRERITKKNKEIKLGYTPRALSLKDLGPEDIEALREQCRYLRVSPSLQQHLYKADSDGLGLNVMST